ARNPMGIDGTAHASPILCIGARHASGSACGGSATGQALACRGGTGRAIMTAIKLLIADVDGTLVTRDNVLTARACAAAARLRAAGVQLAIPSSRPPRGLAMLTGPLALGTPVAAFNGGMLVQPDLVTLIEQRTLPLAVSVEVAEFLLRAGLDL